MATVIIFTKAPKPEAVKQVLSLLDRKAYSFRIVGPKVWALIDPETEQQVTVDPEVAKILRKDIEGFGQITN